MGPTEIVRLLERDIGVAGEPRSLSDAIYKVLIDNNSALSPLEAYEAAGRLEARVRARIVKVQQECTERGLPGSIVIGEFDDTVLGVGFVDYKDQPTIALAKRRRILVPDLHKSIRDLSPALFETFGCAVLRELGAEKTKVTRQSGDQGIDFYGELSLGQFSSLPLPYKKLTQDVRLQFAGQAKHYPTEPIQPSLIRELIGSLTLARHKTFVKREYDPFQDMNLRPFNPLLGMFFTTGRFSSGALALAKNAGVISMDGMQLATFLADCGVGMVTSKEECGFDNGKFNEWLSASCS